MSEGVFTLDGSFDIDANLIILDLSIIAMFCQS